MVFISTAFETGAVVQALLAEPATKEGVMSSTHLDSAKIIMISRLLREARQPGDTQDLSSKAARYLTHRFQAGTFDEARLRIALKQFIKEHRSMKKAIDRWDDEGGAS